MRAATTDKQGIPVHILEQRFLRGPNIHAATPCLLSVLDLDDLYGVSTRDLPQFN
jgi:cyanophycin synthetase